MIDIQIYNNSNLAKIPRKKIDHVVRSICIGEHCTEAQIRIIYETDDVVHNLNREFLGHDYTTDVITFPIEERPIEGEIYISADTATVQAEEYNETITSVLVRLAAHGALHLVGYDDGTEHERNQMSSLETYYMKL
jgi:rRNA maturation RNase YbeY